MPTAFGVTAFSTGLGLTDTSGTPDVPIDGTPWARDAPQQTRSWHRRQIFIDGTTTKDTTPSFQTHAELRVAGLIRWVLLNLNTDSMELCSWYLPTVSHIRNTIITLTPPPTNG